MEALKEFETFEDAKNEITPIVDNIRKFCPLINGICETSCVCYVPARVSKKPNYDHQLNKLKDTFMIHEGHCDNNMFFGKDY